MIKTFENYTKKIWYHGSDYIFDTFDRYESKGPSALGIFVTDDIGLAELFGNNIYKCIITNNNPYKITMSKWNDIRSNYHNNTDYFKKLRNDLIKKGYDSVYITGERWNDEYTEPNIVVLFNTTNIQIFK